MDHENEATYRIGSCYDGAVAIVDGVSAARRLNIRLVIALKHAARSAFATVFRSASDRVSVPSRLLIGLSNE
jgi:hypothetical protein